MSRLASAAAVFLAVVCSAIPLCSDKMPVINYTGIGALNAAVALEKVSYHANEGLCNTTSPTHPRTVLAVAVPPLPARDQLLPSFALSGSIASTSSRAGMTQLSAAIFSSLWTVEGVCTLDLVWTTRDTFVLLFNVARDVIAGVQPLSFFSSNATYGRANATNETARLWSLLEALSVGNATTCGSLQIDLNQTNATITNNSGVTTPCTSLLSGELSREIRRLGSIPLSSYTAATVCTAVFKGSEVLLVDAAIGFPNCTASPACVASNATSGYTPAWDTSDAAFEITIAAPEETIGLWRGATLEAVRGIAVGTGLLTAPVFWPALPLTASVLLSVVAGECTLRQPSSDWLSPLAMWTPVPSSLNSSNVRITRGDALGVGFGFLIVELMAVIAAIVAFTALSCAFTTPSRHPCEKGAVLSTVASLAPLHLFFAVAAWVPGRDVASMEPRQAGMLMSYTVLSFGQWAAVVACYVWLFGVRLRGLFESLQVPLDSRGAESDEVVQLAAATLVSDVSRTSTVSLWRQWSPSVLPFGLCVGPFVMLAAPTATAVIVGLRDDDFACVLAHATLATLWSVTGFATLTTAVLMSRSDRAAAGLAALCVAVSFTMLSLFEQDQRRAPALKTAAEVAGACALMCTVVWSAALCIVAARSSCLHHIALLRVWGGDAELGWRRTVQSRATALCARATESTFDESLHYPDEPLALALITAAEDDVVNAETLELHTPSGREGQESGSGLLWGQVKTSRSLYALDELIVGDDCSDQDVVVDGDDIELLGCGPNGLRGAGLDPDEIPL